MRLAEAVSAAARHAGRAIRHDDRGAAIAEFTMIALLLIFLLFAVLQFAIFFYVRTVVASSAADGARWAANADVDASDGGTRADDLIASGLNRLVSARVTCTGVTGPDVQGLPTVQVGCHGTITSIFVPIGPLLPIDVNSRALKEQRP